MNSLKNFPVGTEVVTTEGCGMANRRGIVIPWSEVPIRKDGTGIPNLPGHYQRPDKTRVVPLWYRDKDVIFLMFTQYLKKV